MKFPYVFFLLLFFHGCFSQKKEINFVNRSGNIVDSVHISVSSLDNYSIKMRNLKVNDSLVNIIPDGVPKSNNHDIIISVTVFFNDEKPIFEYVYNDLEGTLSMNYSILIDEKKHIIWKTFAH